MRSAAFMLLVLALCSCTVIPGGGYEGPPMHPDGTPIEAPSYD